MVSTSDAGGFSGAHHHRRGQYATGEIKIKKIKSVARVYDRHELLFCSFLLLVFLCLFFIFSSSLPFFFFFLAYV